MAKKAFPKEVFVWWEQERDGEQFLMVAQSLEEACLSMGAGEKMEIGRYAISEHGTFTLKVLSVPKSAKK